MLCHLPEGGREEREDKDRNKHREAIKGKIKRKERERERGGEESLTAKMSCVCPAVVTTER